MKKLLIIICTIFLFSTRLAYSQSITTLSCVDDKDAKYQEIIKFDSISKSIIDPLPIDYDLNVTDDIISFKRKVDASSTYSVIIYRNSGKQTIFSKVKGVDQTWSGTCTKVIQNKF